MLKTNSRGDRRFGKRGEGSCDRKRSGRQASCPPGASARGDERGNFQRTVALREGRASTRAGPTQQIEPMLVRPSDLLVPKPIGTKEQMDRRMLLQMISDRILEEAKSLATQRGVSSVEVMTGQGNPHSAILRSARSAHADAIVMGSRGVSNIKGVFLGSVSHKVAHDAAQEAACTCITVT